MKFVLITNGQCFFFTLKGLRKKRGNSPISLRLEKPAVIGACLGDLPRLGALDDQTLHPSPSDFSLCTLKANRIVSGKVRCEKHGDT